MILADRASRRSARHGKAGNDKTRQGFQLTQRDTAAGLGEADFGQAGQRKVFHEHKGTDRGQAQHGAARQRDISQGEVFNSHKGTDTMNRMDAKLRSASPYSQSRAFQTPTARDETAGEHDKRCWRERCHVDGDGMCIIPPMAFKNCIAEAAKYKPTKIKGAGNHTYTKHFEAGVLVTDSTPIGVHIDDVLFEDVFVPADGKRGGQSRVWKRFPLFPEWSATVQFLVLDDLINLEIFRRTLTEAGQFIGLGRFRPRRNGLYGRFYVDDVQIVED